MPVKDEFKAHLGDLAIFPLANTVLFPHTTLPLHIFEPRYRQMVRDALENTAPIAMALLTGRGNDAHGRPLVEPVAGAGFIEAYEELPDGRFMIDLRGHARISIDVEHEPRRLYRSVQATALESHVADAAALDDAMETLQLLLVSMQNVNPRVATYLRGLTADLMFPEDVADVVASVVFPGVETRYNLLRELDVNARMSAVVERLSELLAMATSTGDGTLIN